MPAGGAGATWHRAATAPRCAATGTATGIGIDPEDLPHLYERFYRGKAVSQSKIIGSGLGLAIVKEIVELHDGQIQCESAVGKGTTFRVWLPAPQVEVLSGWGMDIISRR